MENKLVELIDLTKRFGSFIAVDHVNVSLEEGKIYGFIGPNGAGKSTTMALMVGLMNPSSGKAYIQGYEAGTKQAKQLLGYSPEFPDFYRDMSCFDYLVYMAKLSGLNDKEAISRSYELLDEFDLVAFKDALVYKFSTGMKKKVGLAQAMIHRPKLLLLDEPTANLDPKSRYEIMDTLKQLVSKYKMTVLISSHVLSELEMIIDHVIMINKGKLVLDKSVEETNRMFNQGRLKVHVEDDELLCIELRRCPIANQTSIYPDYVLIETKLIDLMKDYIVQLCFNKKLRLHLLEEEKMTLERLYKQLVEVKDDERYPKTDN